MYASRPFPCPPSLLSHTRLSTSQDECLLAGVPDNAADLVTMMQGLHHLPQSLLPTFLSEVSRVLKPGGIFIVREHDCSDALLPMLDLAHSVFNVLTGVSAREEEREIRAFRSVDDWVCIVEAGGLRNTQLYEIQTDDPTVDVMMCFYKPPWTLERGQHQAQECSASDAAPSVSNTVSASAASTSSNTTAFTALSMAQKSVAWILQLINDFEAAAMSLWPQKEYPAQYAMLHSLVKPSATAARSMMQRLDSLMSAAAVNMAEAADTRSASSAAPASPGTDFFPPEIFVAYEALTVRVQSGVAAAPEIVMHSIVSSIVAAFLGDASDPVDAPADAPSHSSSSDGVAGAAAVTVAETRQIILTLQASHPDIMTPAWWRRSGFPKQVQSVVGSMGGSVDAAAQRLAAILDRTSFDELYAAAQCVAGFSHQPNTDIMLGKQHAGNPWWRCVCAILASPSIRITQAMRWAANMLGFSEWITLCETSQALRRHSAIGGSQGQGMHREMTMLVNQTKDALDKCQDITMETKDHKPFPPIPHVAEVLSAR